MAARKASVRFVPKEMKTFSSKDEVGTFDQAMRRGSSAVDLQTKRSKEKSELIKNPEVKAQLMSFIFGGDVENPLEDISSKFEKKNTDLKNKKYSKIGVTSLFSAELTILDTDILDSRVHDIRDDKDPQGIEDTHITQ